MNPDLEFNDLKFGPRDIPILFDSFIKLADQDAINRGELSKKHKYSKAINFYLKHKDDDWQMIERPDWVLSTVNELALFYHLRPILVAGSHGKPLRVLLKHDLIDTFYQEATIVSHYIRRGYRVSWNSVFGQDPPDLMVADPAKGLFVDVEVKVKFGKATVETMFDSLSRGLGSLKRRGREANKMAVVAVHNADDLGWEGWLSDLEVQKRLQSRLSDPAYKIISGVVFSGGQTILNHEDGSRQFGTKYVAFRSETANHPLPYGFLTTGSKI